MSLVEPITQGRPATGEAPFAFDELLYSRTDERGIIRAGNEIFRRVADYGWEELLGAPHRLIRQPETPKAVFWLLWDRIRAGRPAGGYFRNRSRDGLPYWVFAVVTPVAGGFLSVQLKPSSSIFARVQPMYERALAREKEGMSAAASATELLRDIAAGAFASYEEFIAVALAQEIPAREQALARPPPERLGHVAELHSLLRDTLRQQQALLKSFDEIRSVPINLHIVASRLEAYGGPVSTIAENYRLMSGEVIRRLEEMAGGGEGQALGEKMQAAVAAGLYHVAASLVFSEMEGRLTAENCGPGVDAAREAELLHTLDSDCRRRAENGLAEVSRASRRLAQACEELKRLMLGLDSIRVLCRVEAGRMDVASEGLQAIISMLDRFHAEVAQKLDTIFGLAGRIRHAAAAAAAAAEAGA